MWNVKKFSWFDINLRAYRRKEEIDTFKILGKILFLFLNFA